MVGTGVGVGVNGAPPQIATLTNAIGSGVAVVLLDPPPPQLHNIANATNDSTGTITRHLRHHNID